MSETANLCLPLVQAAQAQKHVTVNEALALLDAMAQLSVVSRSMITPPAAEPDGTAHIVPPGASGAWQDRAGSVAVFANGGWVFLSARAGWKAWVRDEACHAVYDGAVWVAGAMALSPSGAASLFEVLERDVVLSPGQTVTAADVIPARSTVFGVSGIVIDAILGDLASWRLGVPGATDRYGSGLGLPLGTWVEGLNGQPQAHYSATPLVLSAEGGMFAGGRVRLAVHLLRMQRPRA
jgi:hypothetical protein